MAFSQFGKRTKFIALDRSRPVVLEKPLVDESADCLNRPVKFPSCDKSQDACSGRSIQFLCCRSNPILRRSFAFPMRRGCLQFSRLSFGSTLCDSLRRLSRQRGSPPFVLAMLIVDIGSQLFAGRCPFKRYEKFAANAKKLNFRDHEPKHVGVPGDEISRE